MEIANIHGADEEWDRFVWASPGGTIFSTLKFLSYHSPGRIDPMNLAVRERGALVCVVAGGVVIRGDRRVFRSPEGASFGGFVFGRGVGLKQMADSIQAATSAVREAGLEGVEIVLGPPCYVESEDQAEAFLLTQAGYTLMGRDATMVVPLEVVDESDFHPTVARNLRRSSSAGVEIVVGGDLGGFYEVLAENLAAKGATPTHTLEDLKRLVALFPDRLVLVTAVRAGTVLGGCLTVLCNRLAALVFYICDDIKHRDLRIAEAVVSHTIKAVRGRGLKFLDFGTVSMGGSVNWGLVKFKSKFAPRTYAREHYRMDFGERGA